MELSVRSFHKEVKEGETPVAFIACAVIGTCDVHRVLSFYRVVEKKNAETAAVIAEAERSAFRAATPKEKYAFRPVRFCFGYEIEKREGATLVKRKTEILRNGRVLACYEDSDVWDENGFLVRKKERKRQIKLSFPLIFEKIKRFPTRTFRKSS